MVSQLIIKLILGFFLLFIIIKIVGKKVINQITPFTFISAIVLGELIGNSLYDKNVQPLHVIISIAVWGGLLVLMEFIGQKSLFFRTLFEGKPSALIKNGVIDRNELKRNHMNISQLQSLLRQSETFSVREVAFCFLEANGSLSIYKKSKYQETQQQDFNMPEQPVYTPVSIIRDGEVLKDELKELGQDESWLKSQLLANGVSDYRDVFLAEWLEGDGLFVQKM